MKNLSLTLALFGCIVLLASPVQAQGMVESAAGFANGVGSVLGTDVRQNNSVGTVMDNLKRNGYTDITGPQAGYTNGPMQFSATSPSGTPVDVTVDPMMGQVTSVIPK